MPSLRERPGDIPLLAEHFLARHGPSGAVLSPAAAAVLQAAQWPGNVRQLENAMRELRLPSAGGSGDDDRAAPAARGAALSTRRNRCLRPTFPREDRRHGAAAGAVVARRQPDGGRARTRHRACDLLPLVARGGTRIRDRHNVGRPVTLNDTKGTAAVVVPFVSLSASGAPNVQKVVRAPAEDDVSNALTRRSAPRRRPSRCPKGMFEP